MSCVAPFFKGTTINKNMRLDHESLKYPETEILKYHEYDPLTLTQGLTKHQV